MTLTEQIQADAAKLRAENGIVTVRMTAYLMLRHYTAYRTVLAALGMTHKYNRIVGQRNPADGRLVTVAYLKDKAVQQRELFDAMLEVSA